MITLPDYANDNKSFEIKLNSKHRTEKLKPRDTKTRKIKTQKQENLVLPKEYVENGNLYKRALKK